MTPFMALANHKNSETWKFEFSMIESNPAIHTIDPMRFVDS